MHNGTGLSEDDLLAQGARNLLRQCAGLAPGDSLVIFHEDPELGWYDRAAPEAIAAAARAIGASVTLIEVDAPGRNESRAEAIEAAMAEHDQTLYMARLGDQDRFAPSRTARPAVMCYATDAAALASPFGTFDHRAFVALNDAVNAVLAKAGSIRVTCPAGTDLIGSVVPGPDEGPEEVTVRRFPMCVYKPVPMRGFTGHVALTHFLVPTGSRPYEPPFVPIPDTVRAAVHEGTITGFSGKPDTIAAIEAHYAHVSGLFGIEPMVTHSWHSGLHPGCSVRQPATADPDKWGNTIFGNPRILHCHTCGAYPPGEICWMVIDHTIQVDDVVLWEQGYLNVDGFAALARVANAWPGLRDLLASPSPEIGLA
ncbi:MAG: hypothetical protein AAGL24_08285 [Pseudomonadota bacterium]